MCRERRLAVAPRGLDPSHRTASGAVSRRDVDHWRDGTMKLLVLGGTAFLGRHVVAEALEQSHEVTVFTRGHTNPWLFPEAEHLTGDRDGNLHALVGRRWDGVIDTTGYVPRVVRQSAELLRCSVLRYVYVSSVSVYADHRRPFDETAPLATLDDAATEDIWPNYGALKAACEGVLDEIY